MRKPGWIIAGQNTVLFNRQLRDGIYANPQVQQALVNYITNLHLDRISDPNRALQLFDKAIRDFTQACHTRIDQETIKANFNQQDLNNPANLERELQNPNSYLNTFLNNQIQTINDEITAQTFIQTNLEDEEYVAENEVAVQQQTFSDDDENKPHGLEKAAHNVEKCAAIGLAVKLIDEADPKLLETADKAIDDAFHKITGRTGNAHEMKTEFKEIKDDVKELKPSPRPHFEENKDERK